MSSKLHIATPFESICIICFSFLFAPQFYQKRFLILLNDKIVVDINGRSSRYYCAEWHKESMGKTVFNCGRCYSLVSVCVHWVHFLCTTTTKIWMRLHLYFIFLCLFAFLFLWLWRNSEIVRQEPFSIHRCCCYGINIGWQGRVEHAGNISTFNLCECILWSLVFRLIRGRTSNCVSSELNCV